MDDSSTGFSLTNRSLDEAKLSADDAEAYVLQWLSSAARFLNIASVEHVKSVQHDLEATLLDVLISPRPQFPPGRPLRNLVANCFITIYTRGESKTLFDTLIALMKVAGDFKAPVEKDTQKIASLHCIGELMASFGAKVTSVMAEVATTTMKLYRSSNSIVLRYHAVNTLRKALTNARRAVPESLARDILKQMKSALNEKALPIRRAASEVLTVMYPLSGHEWSASEIETIVTLCIRSLEGSDQITRHSLAQLVAKVLSSSQTEVPVSVSDNSKKPKNEDEDDESIPGAVPPEEVKTILTCTEMLSQLSTPFNKPHTSHKTRVGIFDFYSALFTVLGPSFVETNYATVVQHFMSEIVTNTRNSSNRYEVLLIRKLVGILLRDLVGVRLLNEQAQIAAIQELSNLFLKRWPALLHGQVAPSPHVLAIVLKEVAGLLQQLGNAPPPVQDALSEPLTTLLAHPNHTVRVHASWTLRIFCCASPLRMPKIIFDVQELLQRDINLMTSQSASSDISTRALGHAYGLAALVTVIPEKPLYVSYDISAKVLDMAIQLLKRAGDHDLQVSGLEIEIAWTCIASLMTLGPNFVKAHLPQILVLWRNALPKPTNKDTTSGGGRTRTEWAFLLHVRESALGAILCFLHHNSPSLVTLDVARRITTMLSNAFLFADAFASHHVEEPLLPGPEQATIGPSLRSREFLLRRRVFQCFSVLGTASVPEGTQIALMQSAISLVASPDGYAGSTVQAAIASSSGSFTSIWQTFDGYAYGVTSLSPNGNATLSSLDDLAAVTDSLNRDSIEVMIDELLRKPILRSCEHDTLSVCQPQFFELDAKWPESPPPATATVDAALQLFARLLPQQDLSVASRLVTQLTESARSSKFDKNVGRKAAASINVTIAVTLALREASASSTRQVRDVFGHAQMTAPLSAILKDALTDGDPVLRLASCEAIGLLSGLADSVFLASQMKSLVDEVVNNRDPFVRAGCALALGSIFDHVGSLAAGPLLKTTVNILMSLSKDAHPVVHFWSLQSLSRVVNAASLTYAPYVGPTLGMLFSIYMLESHEPEGGSLANVNAKGDLPAYQVSCRIIDAVISILGPDIQESTRTRQLILDLVQLFMNEQDEGIQVEAIKCIQHFLMFAPEHVPVPELVDRFRTHLNSSRRPLKLASINALYQLVQKDALLISKVGGDRLVEDLFSMLDGDPSIEGVRKVISSWLQQTVTYNPSAWIDLCQKIMSRTTASQQILDAAAKGAASFDDEGESLNAGGGGTSNTNHLTSRWRTQLFALQCLHDICITIASSGRVEQLDLVIARRLGVPTAGLLVSRIADLIKMAFAASTAHVTEIRLEGLVVLRDVIEIFAKAADPDYEDALLLEQYQAPITAALTPAFTADSTPEILASAIGACAVFVGCGIVKDISRMGRILKLLTSALEQCKGPGMLSLGGAAEASPNASAMLRIATLSAWAELAAGSERPYLREVVKPYRSTLATLWVAALRDYASIRAGSEVSQDTSSAPLDTAFASLGKDILLPYYATSWPIILKAISVAMEAHDPFIRGAMDGIDTPEVSQVNGSEKTVYKDPVSLFFVVFGLVYEAVSMTADSTSAGQNNLSLVALRAMKNLVRPEYAGRALLEPTLFDELLSAWYRIAMTESYQVQVYLVDTVATFASCQIIHAANVGQTEASSPQMQCLRLCAFVLKNALPGSRHALPYTNFADRVQLLRASFDALSVITCLLPREVADEARAVAISLYADLLKDETSEDDYASPILPSLMALISQPCETPEKVEKFSQLIHGLLSACIVNIDEMKGRQGAISSKKIKCNFLAAVLVLTVVPQSVKVGRAVVERCCFLISEKLSVADETALTAAHCAKTLLVASASGNRMLRHCAKMLLPGIISFVAKCASSSRDQPDSNRAAAIGEILKALGALLSTVVDDLRVRVLGVVLPVITLLLDPSEAPASGLHSQALHQLLSFASTFPEAFRDATSRLDPSTRERLEGSVRQALNAKSSASSSSSAKPQISLRSF